MSKVLDARIQQIERLMTGTICKQQKLAEMDPAEKTYKKPFMLYKMAVEGVEDTLHDYASLITLRLIRDYLPVTEDEARGLYSDLHQLRQELKAIDKFDVFMNILRQQVIDSYIEMNPYYRMLLGVPPYDEDPANFIMINGQAIHELDLGQILELKRNGKLDTLIADNPDKPYLRFIDKDIDLIDARTAPEYAILWTPKKREFNIYREMFNNERKEWMKTYYNEYANEASDYNETFELTILKLRAIITFYIHSYSNLLNKSSFTKEESEDLFASFGLNFPADMPDSYRDTLTFVLNYLNTNKGTNYAIKFITKKLFTGLRLFKYWIRKKKNNITTINKAFPVDKDGVLLPPATAIFEESQVYSDDEIQAARTLALQTDPTANIGDDEMSYKATELYTVDYILRPINSTNIIDFSTADVDSGLGSDKKIVNTGNRNRYLVNHARSVITEEDINRALQSQGVDHKDIILSYDDIKELDPRWSDEESLREDVHKEEFSYVESKYIGVDNIVNIQDFTVSIGIIHRYFVQKKDLLMKSKFNYPGTGANHSFFNLWVYYMTLTNYGWLKRLDMPIGDTVEWPRYFQGFNTIKTHPTIRLYWLLVFAQYNIDVTLEEFPDPLNDNDTFVRLMQHIERSIGLGKFVDNVITKARTFVEVDMILELQRHVRNTVKRPEVFDSTVPDERKSWMSYLSANDGELAFLADDIITRGAADLSMEMDNISNFFIQTLQEIENDINGDFPDMRESLFQTNMMYGGLSQHLLHVIRLFKAWSVEFIGEKSALIITSEDSDPLVMIDQMTPNYNIREKYRWNVTQDHWVEFTDDENTVWDDAIFEDACYLVTRYGDIKIS